ncbi:MAG: glycosyltransferase family 1 protein [Pedobacter sp.]|nr:MAG: glycosyltransferase family 1 protein [Pedobacter sp.]
MILAIKLAFKILFLDESYDMIYGSTPHGLELLVFLRSLCLYNKPIVIWQHRALKSSTNPIRNLFLKFYYRGFDKFIMFSELHIKETLSNKTTRKSKLVQMHWGPDINYFDKIISETKAEIAGNYFCSTGRENRDFPTLIQGFAASINSSLRIYTTKQHGKMNNEKLLLDYGDKYNNVEVYIIENTPNLNQFLSQEVYKSKCAVISCHEHNYTVGLTSLLEAMALGKAVITSDNPYFPIDVEKEGIGIKIPYGDPAAWTEAVDFISNNPEICKEMGKKARKFIDDRCNSDLLSFNVAKCLYDVSKRKFNYSSTNS